jgi:hypothetical protein
MGGGVSLSDEYWYGFVVHHIFSYDSGSGCSVPEVLSGDDTL